ncbi:hypothetical protein MCEMIH15_01897 [Caulobacteraceae bacterium]
MQDNENCTYLSFETVCVCTDLTLNTTLEAVKTGSFPPPVEFIGDEVWLSTDIADWLENSPHSPLNFAWKEAA